MTAPNAEKDNTTLLISNDFTDDYDMMDDLVKMRGDYYQYFDLPVLASLNNAGEMAFNALPDVSAEAGVPLVYVASQAGTGPVGHHGQHGTAHARALIASRHIHLRSRRAVYVR